MLTSTLRSPGATNWWRRLASRNVHHRGPDRGLKRRTDECDERSNKAVTAVADLLLIRSEIDHDSFFTNVAKQRNIPIIRTKEALDFKYALGVLFGVN